MEAVINDYISRELVQDPALLPLANATSLLETGILDSLSLLRLVVFVQERFGIVVDEVDLVPENFASVDAICAYLRSRAGEERARQAAMGEAAAKAAGPPRGRRLGRAGRGRSPRGGCCAERRALPTGWQWRRWQRACPPASPTVSPAGGATGLSGTGPGSAPR